MQDHIKRWNAAKSFTHIELELFRFYSEKLNFAPKINDGKFESF